MEEAIKNKLIREYNLKDAGTVECMLIISKTFNTTSRKREKIIAYSTQSVLLQILFTIIIKAFSKKYPQCF